MEQNQELDKYSKAKIEEPNLRLPAPMLKVNTDASTGNICYMKIFEDDPKRARNLAKAIEAGAKLDRKVYRIRNMELVKAIGEDFEDMKQIHRVSKATIGLLVDAESDFHTHSYIDLVGTVEEVKMAEELILDNVLKTYGPVFPVILMPPTIYGHEIRLTVDKVGRLVGDKNSNILAMEVVSGAWLQIDNKPPPGGQKWERVLNIYGPKTHVVKAVSLAQSCIFEPGESYEAEKELEEMFKELSFGEMMEGMKPRTREIVQQLENSKKRMIEEAKDIEESISTSGDQSEKEKQQELLQVKEASASGSGQAEEEKQQKHEEDVEGSESESKDKKQQSEEHVKEVVSVEASQQKV